MPAITDRRAARLSVTRVIAALLVSGCVSVSRTAEPTAQSAPTTSTTPAATATASGPMTDKEVVWVNQITKLRHAISETISPSSSTDLTREELARWENAMRGCSRTLARIGSPSARLQPVYALVKQSCQEFDKGAACFAAAAPIIASSTRVREAQEALDCGSRAIEKGTTLLIEAEAKGLGGEVTG